MPAREPGSGEALRALPGSSPGMGWLATPAPGRCCRVACLPGGVPTLPTSHVGHILIFCRGHENEAEANRNAAPLPDRRPFRGGSRSTPRGNRRRADQLTPASLARGEKGGKEGANDGVQGSVAPRKDTRRRLCVSSRRRTTPELRTR